MLKLRLHLPGLTPNNKTVNLLLEYHANWQETQPNQTNLNSSLQLILLLWIRFCIMYLICRWHDDRFCSPS